MQGLLLVKTQKHIFILCYRYKKFINDISSKNIMKMINSIFVFDYILILYSKK